MFVEPAQIASDSGWIEVICGCMFSGKTEELVRRVNRARIAKIPVKIFKPALDTRYSASHVVTHNSYVLEAILISEPEALLNYTDNTKLIAIDEAQFFGPSIVSVCNQLANMGKRVIVAGLDMDSDGKPFGSMPNLMATAEFVTKLHAICAVSGNLASFSKRLKPVAGTIVLGAQDMYEPRSRSHFNDKN